MNYICILGIEACTHFSTGASKRGQGGVTLHTTSKDRSFPDEQCLFSSLMGLQGGLVRRVFSSKRDSGADHKGRRISSIRFYLCGDELDAAQEAEDDDLASGRCHGVTEVQPAEKTSGDEEAVAHHSTEVDEETRPGVEDSPGKGKNCRQEDDAAVLIQSAFRGFLTRQKYRHAVVKPVDACDPNCPENLSTAVEATSIDLEVGDPVPSYVAQEENAMWPHRLQRKTRQTCRPKEVWDDSTLSSNISKMRIQSRLEASTRRERALAYAFSQQLRTCTTRRKSLQTDSSEPNMGWNWLERWMATRQRERSFIDNSRLRRSHPTHDVPTNMIIKKKFDMVAEEKESCGSNDVSVNFDGHNSSPSQTPRNGYGPACRSRLKVLSSAPRSKAMQGYHCPRRLSKVGKKESEKEVDRDRKSKLQGTPKNIYEIRERDALEAPSDY